MQTELLPVGEIYNPVVYNTPPKPITKGSAPAYLLNRTNDRRKKRDVTISIPVLAIYPNKIVGYNEVERVWQRSLVGIMDENLKPKNETNGDISKSAKKRINNAVNWLYYFSKEKTTTKSTAAGKVNYKFRVNFITLTLPSEQQHEDKFIKAEMLNPFLEWMRYNGVKSYVWKAEPQLNGNIHFHITTNVFLDWELIREKWNSICERNGYIEPYHQKFKGCTLDGYKQILKKDGFHVDDTRAKRAWEKGTADNWRNPNSTDVHSTKKVRKMAAYMAKYMTKKSEVYLMKWVRHVEEANAHPLFKDRDKATDFTDSKTGLIRVFVRRVIRGRQWFLSTNLSNIKAPVIEATSETVEKSYGVLKDLKSSLLRAYDYASILFFDYRDAIKAKCTSFIDELIELSLTMTPVIN